MYLRTQGFALPEQRNQGYQSQLTRRGQLQCPVARLLSEPAFPEEMLEKLARQLARKVVTTLGPVQATVGQTPPAFGRTACPQFAVKPQLGQPVGAGRGDRVAAINLLKPSLVEQRLEDCNPDLTCKVAIAAACISQTLLGRGRPCLGVGAALSNQSQSLEGVSHVCVGKAKVPVASANLAGKQASVEKLGEMPAGRRGRDRSGLGQFTRAGKFAAQEEGQHTGPTRVCDQGGNACQAGLVALLVHVRGDD